MTARMNGILFLTLLVCGQANPQPILDLVVVSPISQEASNFLVAWPFSRRYYTPSRSYYSPRPTQVTPKPAPKPVVTPPAVPKPPVAKQTPKLDPEPVVVQSAANEPASAVKVSNPKSNPLKDMTPEEKVPYIQSKIDEIDKRKLDFQQKIVEFEQRKEVFQIRLNGINKKVIELEGTINDDNRALITKRLQDLDRAKSDLSKKVADLNQKVLNYNEMISKSDGRITNLVKWKNDLEKRLQKVKDKKPITKDGMKLPSDVEEVKSEKFDVFPSYGE